MEPKVTLLLAKTRGGFLNCHLFKNGGRGTKPTYIFMVIIPLLVIELKATPNGNPNDYVLVFCFGMPFQEVPIFPFSVFDFLRLPGQYSIMIE